MNAIEVRDLSKTYPLGGSSWSRFRHALAGGNGSRAPAVRALSGVAFDVRRGEAFGIVGANGSGKSTLLQIAAGILQPSSGEAVVTGRISALLELGSGFSLEFTGRQNVYLNASILGLTREETDARFEAIAHFASIGAFIDQPVRTYSSGMVLRLAFSVIAHSDPEVLIVDEALAVGDIAFRQRCMRRIHELRTSGVTILFVSHDSGDVKALCERCLWLDRGAMKMLGPADDVIAAYLSATVQRERVRDAESHEHRTTARPVHSASAARVIEGRHRFGNKAAAIVGAELIESRRAALRMTFEVSRPLSNPIVGFLVRNEKGETIFGSNSMNENCPLPEMVPGDFHTVDFHWDMPDLAAGCYFISIAVSDGTLDEFGVCDYVEDALTFESCHAGIAGYLRIPCTAVSIRRD
ncbi:MAG: ABC transporter ATP-binding protein [Acidobacteriota bacterium]|nr:ABC transporter ATP-binding protein [Acidobacteriota bacterium]